MSVLLVDDDSISAEVEAIVLRGCGVSVDIAHSGAEAMEMVRTKTYALIFMVVHMSGMNGFETAAQIRTYNVSVPIIALSAEPLSTENPEYIRAGMNGILSKPMQPIALSEILSMYLEIPNGSNTRWRRKTDILFDVEMLRSQVGDEKAMQMIIRRFIDVHGRDGEAVRQCLEADDVDGACVILHDLIGSSGNFFCSRLYQITYKLNQELKYGRRNSLLLFYDVLQDTMDMLHAFCGDRAVSQTPVDGTPQKWSVLRGDFYDLASQFDIAACDLFNANIGIFEENLKPQLFAAVKAAVDHYDFMTVVQLWEENHV